MWWVVNVTLRPLYSGEKDPVPIVQEAVWAAGSVWSSAENLGPYPSGIRSPGLLTRSELLYRLCYRDLSNICSTVITYVSLNMFKTFAETVRTYSVHCLSECF